MTRRFSEKAAQDYEKAIPAIQKAFDKQMKLLTENWRHPSLRAKKIDETNNIWQGRVTRDWRFYFQITDDTYVILRIVPHPK